MGKGEGTRRSSRQESKAKQEEAALSTVASLSGRLRLQEGSSGELFPIGEKLVFFGVFSCQISQKT